MGQSDPKDIAAASCTAGVEANGVRPVRDRAQQRDAERLLISDWYARQVWKLTACDLCEIARNSVMQSGFPHDTKKHWVSDEYWLPGPAGNDMRKTNVPNIRMQFRLDVLATEHKLVTDGAAR
eukprot:6419017-Pyramimonas_sp.AAC.1